MAVLVAPSGATFRPIVKDKTEARHLFDDEPLLSKSCCGVRLNQYLCQRITDEAGGDHRN